MLYRIASCNRLPFIRHYSRWKASESFSIDVKVDENKVLKLSGGKLAKLADGSCVAQSGQTAVMATVVCKPSVVQRGFLPLTVDYRQKAAAAGRIPTNFIRREVGQTEKEILTARAIDRSIRPLFTRNYSAETQVVCAQLALDGENDPDVMAINAVSGALAFSDVPGWNGPIGAVRIALVDDRFVINPTRSELNPKRPSVPQNADEQASAGVSNIPSVPLDLIVVANERREVIMLEGEAHELDPVRFKNALRHAVEACQPLITAIREAQAAHGRLKRPLSSVIFVPSFSIVPASTTSAATPASGASGTAPGASSTTEILHSELAKELDGKLIKAIEARAYEMSASKFREVLSDATHNKFSRDDALRQVREYTATQLRTELPTIAARLLSDRPTEIGRQGEQATPDVTNNCSNSAPAASVTVSSPHLSDIISNAVNDLVKRVYRELVFDTSRRVDGRSLTDMRPITCEVGLYEPLHGSGLFQRGQTQVLSTVAFDAPDSAMRLDPVTMLLSGASEKSFILHYEMPPFATNETGRAGFLGRRERGHGALAERAIRPLIAPPHLDGKRNLVPFTTRLTCEVLESNGSSSMASVCAGSLALFDAGVPLARHVAGVAMGLLIDPNLVSVNKATSGGDGQACNPDAYRVLTDLVGIEDYFGEMDCKLAGTERGFTAVQMDLKVPGVSISVLERVLDQAHSAICRLVEILRGTIASPRDNSIRENMPVYESISVPLHMRANVIGFGGVNLKRIQAQCGVSISAPLGTDDSSTFEVFAPNRVAFEEARAAIQRLVQERANLEREVALEFGSVYEARIVDVRDYGVLVQLDPRLQPALVHNSQLDAHRVVHPSALRLAVGQTISVKYFGRDPHTGQMRLSRKALFASTSTPASASATASSPAPIAASAATDKLLRKLTSPLTAAAVGEDLNRLEDYAFERETTGDQQTTTDATPQDAGPTADSEATSERSATGDRSVTVERPASAERSATVERSATATSSSTSRPSPTTDTTSVSAPVELVFGKHYEVIIVEVRDNGVLVDLGAGRQPALVHNGQLGSGRVANATELGLLLGQRIRVKYFGNDPQTGLVRLSRKAALLEPNAPVVCLFATSPSVTSNTRPVVSPPPAAPAKIQTAKQEENPWSKLSSWARQSTVGKSDNT